MITTTLNRVKEILSKSELKRLLKHLEKTIADDEPLPFSTIVESNGLEAALKCCRAEPQYEREWRLFAVWCAREVQHLMKDQRSIDALDVAERFANGKATKEELVAALGGARDATWEAGIRRFNATWAAEQAAVEAAKELASGTIWAATWAALTALDELDGSSQRTLTQEFLRIVTETEVRAA